MSQPDQRRGVCSASSVNRVEHCPGSHKLSQCCPPSLDSDDSRSGTRIHAALEHGPMSEPWEALTPAEEQTASMCHHQMLQVIADWDGQEDSCADIAEDLWNRGDKEIRLGLTALGKCLPVTPDSKATFIFTGMADVVIRTDETMNRLRRAIVLDYKTGREGAGSSAENAQLRALAVLVSVANPTIEEITVAIIQPWVGKPQPAVFDKAALTAAKEWLREVIHKEKNATEKDLHAGEWCKFCPAAENGCPALKSTALAAVASVEIESLPAGKEKEAIFARLMETDADTLLNMMEKRSLLSQLCESIEGAIRRRVEAGDPDICAQWQLTDGRKVRKIVDPAAAYEALQPHGVTLEDLWAASDLSLGPLEEAIRARSGRKKRKDGKESTHYNMSVEDAKDLLTSSLLQAGALEIKQNSAQLKRIKSLV